MLRLLSAKFIIDKFYACQGHNVSNQLSFRTCIAKKNCHNLAQKAKGVMANETWKNQIYRNSAVEDKFTTETIIYTTVTLTQKKQGLKL